MTSVSTQVKEDVLDQGEAILEKLFHSEGAIYHLSEPRKDAENGK